MISVSGAPRRRRAPAWVMAHRGPPPDTGPDSYRVWEIRTQKKKGTSKEDETRARDLLERVAWQVQPIMRKRSWRVGVLLEMPDKVRDRLGDNYNRGERVRLKLRKGNGAWEDYEQVLAVMLHELVHNRIGPHDGKFFALLAELEKECEDLMAKGMGGTGAGFDAKGTKLGHRGGWGGLETRDPKTAAIDAARKRAKLHETMGPPGGRKLCDGVGDKLFMTKSPRSAAAEAAERRARNEAFARAHGLMDDVVVLSDSDDADEDGGVGKGKSVDVGDEDAKPKLAFSFRRGRRDGGACPCCAALGVDDAHLERCRGKDDADATKATEPTRKSEKRRVETSNISLRNSERARVSEDVIVIDDSDADAADADDAVPLSSPPLKPNAKAKPNATRKESTWQCKACTLRNPESASTCAACERWRFSRGPPAASRPTGFGADD